LHGERPGEAAEADIALAGGKGKFALFRRGARVASLPENDALAALVEEVRKWLDE